MVQDPIVANRKYNIIIGMQWNNQFSNADITVILTNGCVH